MTLDLKPVPSFYCCYLLRSKARHDKLYVGSTPNPKRRLDQHNGVVKGGAKRTGFRGGIWRPWEMSLIVTGFPSNIAALQFEWAWQNSHLTRKISKEDRISIAQTITKWNKRKGKIINKPARLPVSLKDKLANLHLLLRVPSFARWPLQLRFFREDIYDSWITYVEEIGSASLDSLHIVRDYEGGSEATDTASFPQARINALDVSYLPLKDRLEKTLLLKNSTTLKCACCPAPVDMENEHILVCTKDTCYSVSHLGCLSSHFLKDTDELIPTEGDCPKCKTRLRWVDLVQEMTLRTRDMKQVTKLLKPKRKKAGTASTQVATQAIENDEDTDEEEINAEDVLDEPSMHEAEKWDRLSVASMDSEADTGVGKKIALLPPARKYDPTIVIEDSEQSDVSSDWKMI